MLSNVSWGEYLTVVMVLLVAYYLFIGLKYYWEEIRALLSGKLVKKEKQAIQRPGQPLRNAINDPSFDELETIVNDLRYAVLEKAGRSVNKQELLSLIKDRLKDYTGLQKPSFRVAINNFIITNTREICGIVFDEYELNSAWDSMSR